VADSTFVYVTYIRSTPAKIYAALTDARVTRKYWMMENVSDWKPGSPWEHRDTDRRRSLRLVGEVLEAKPPRRLVISWAFPRDRERPAKHSRVAFDIEPVGKGMTRLTVTHSDLRARSGMDKGIREGWPRVLSSLKSFLETRRALDTWAWKR